jgi:hypothetical protein
MGESAPLAGSPWASIEEPAVVLLVVLLMGLSRWSGGPGGRAEPGQTVADRSPAPASEPVLFHHRREHQ